MLNPFPLSKTKKIFILAVSVFFLSTIYVHADVIHLYSGEIIKGKVISHNAELIKFDKGINFPVTYYLEDIDTINGQNVSIWEQRQVRESKRKKPKTDIATLDDISIFKSRPSPLAIKPSEAPNNENALDTDDGFGQFFVSENDKEKGLPAPVFTIGNRKIDPSDLLTKKILYKLILIFAVIYIFSCLPLMLIARKLGCQLTWLVWIPVVQNFYLVHMAKKPI